MFWRFARYLAILLTASQIPLKLSCWPSHVLPGAHVMNGYSTPSHFAVRLASFQKADDERNALFAEVISKYEELQLQYAEKCSDYEDAKESRRTWQLKAGQFERSLADQKQVSVRQSNTSHHVMSGLTVRT
jgi:hypothetical protein